MQPLKKFFGNQLDKNYSKINKLRTRQEGWQGLAKLDHDLWEQILTTAEIDIKKNFYELSEQEIFNIINSHSDIFGLHDKHKQFVLYPEFWKESHDNDASLEDLEKTSEIEIPKQKSLSDFAYYSFEHMNISVRSFWDVFNRKSINDIYEQLQNYFKCSPEERKNHILKKILTNDFVNIDGVLSCTFNEKKFSDRRDFIKTGIKNLTKNTEWETKGGGGIIENATENDENQEKIEFVYYALGEFFDGAFIDIIGKDNIKKYYADNKIESDLFRDNTTQINTNDQKEESNNKQKQSQDERAEKLKNQNQNPENNQAQNFVQSEHNKLQDNTNSNTLLNTNRNDPEHEEKNKGADKLTNRDQNLEHDPTRDFVQNKPDKQSKLRKEKKDKDREQISTSSDIAKNGNKNEATDKLINQGFTENNEGKQLIDKKSVDKADNLQFYERGFWISLSITIIFGLGSGVAAILFGIFWFIAIPSTGVIATGYFLCQFQKNKLREGISDNFTSVDDSQNGYSLKSKIPDLSQSQNKETETISKITKKFLINNNKDKL